MKKENTTTIYSLTADEVKEHPFFTFETDGQTSFYRYLSDELSIPLEEIDCRDIDVAPNMVQFWINDAKEKGLLQETIMMNLLMAAPKENESLKDNQICIRKNYLVK